MTSVQSLADALAAAARQQGETTPTVRGGDWQMDTVTAVHADGTLSCGQIRARRLDSYLNPAVGDLVALLRSGTGNWIALDRLATTAGTAWTPYSPEWTAETTSPSIGNGTLEGRYIKIGRTVTAQMHLSPGSTTNVGSGRYRLSLPFTSADAGQTYIGHAHLFQSTTNRWGGQFVISPNQSASGPFLTRSATDPRLEWMTNAIPAAFSSGNSLRITVTYESAT